MMPRVVVLLLICLVLAAPSSGFAAEPESAIGFVERYTSVWNRHDGAAVAALFTADADLVVGSLPRVEGREQIGEWWQGYFDRIDRGRKGAFEVLSERSIATDVLLLNVGSTTAGVGADGEELPTRRARGTWVVVRRNGTWQIAAMRAQPAVGEDRSAPGTDR